MTKQASDNERIKKNKIPNGIFTSVKNFRSSLDIVNWSKILEIRELKSQQNAVSPVILMTRV